VLAGLLCAAPLLAATAEASTGMIEREQLRAALRAGPHAARANVLPLPLPERPRASAAASGETLARIARSNEPAHLLVGVRAHEDMDDVAAALRALGASPDRLDITGVIAATVPSGATRSVATGTQSIPRTRDRDPASGVAALLQHAWDSAACWP